MIRINLLPVREARRKADARQQLLVGALALGVVAGGLVLLHASLLSDISSAGVRLRTTEAQIKRFQPQIKQVQMYKAKKKEIGSKLDVIEGLERSRSGPVHMLDELSTLTPERLWLTKLEAERREVTLEGMSLDNEVIAGFLTALSHSPYFTGVELDTTELKKVGAFKVNTFKIRAKLTSPEAGGGASARAGGYDAAPLG